MSFSERRLAQIEKSIGRVLTREEREAFLAGVTLTLDTLKKDGTPND